MYTIQLSWVEVVRKECFSHLDFPTKQAAREFVEAIEDGDTSVLEDRWEDIYTDQESGTIEQESEPDEYTVEILDQTCLEEESHA